MTVTQRKPQNQPEDVQINEPGVQYSCDACACDLTYTIRMKCADPVCTATEDGVDICPSCFCAGKEFAQHKRGHAYRVIEFNSYPIFTEDWGADEELLLLRGIVSHGIGNWKKIAEHVGTRTKEEVEEHYNKVYVESPDWPLPADQDRVFDIDPSEFQERKRRRIEEMNSAAPPPHKPAPVSLPAVHEIAGYLPGRLEFEHEPDNEAEDLVKDLEFGVVLEYGGDDIPEDTNDLDVKARVKWEEERKLGMHPFGPNPNGVVHPGGSVGYPGAVAGKGPPPPPILPSGFATKGVFSNNGTVHSINGVANGYHTPSSNGRDKSEDVKMANGTGDREDDDESEEPTHPPPMETRESLAFKLTILEMYSQRVEKREEAKHLIFNRGLLEYKKMQANDKKRPREEKEFLHRLRPFARLQTSEEYEAFTSDMLYETLLRKRIQELQHYRRLGLQTVADIEKHEQDVIRRAQLKAVPHVSRPNGRSVSRADSVSRDSHERELTPKISGTGPPARKFTAPLDLANSPELHLLTQPEQALCSSLRIMPKAYLVVKETLVREYARRGGKLRRREARELVKIDVNKTSRVWDFLVQAGFLKITQDPPPAAAAALTGPAASANNPNGPTGTGAGHGAANGAAVINGTTSAGVPVVTSLPSSNSISATPINGSPVKSTAPSVQASPLPGG